MTTYQDNAATIEHEEVLQEGSSCVIDVDFNNANASSAKSVPLYGEPGFMEYSRSLDTRSIGYRIVKRLFDLVFSCVVIVAAFIPLLVLSIFIAVDTKAFPIYSQERVGHRGPFRFYKLRSMVRDSDDIEKHFTPEQFAQWNKEHKVDSDPRVTKLGALLRKTSLDELPQFFNVVLGQIPQRILKTGQGGTFDSPSLFALPAKEMRTKKALFPQVKVASGTCLRTVRNFLENLTAAPAKSQAVFAKRKFAPISWGGASLALPSTSTWLLSHVATYGLVN